MSKSFGTPGESAHEQAANRRRRREELERLRQREQHWEGGATGEELTATAIERWCPNAVVLHDRRVPDSQANIDHVVLVPSGVWVIDSKRPKGRIKVEDAKDGTQKLLINGENRTSLVHKLTNQVNIVKVAMAELDPTVPVYGAFCFHLQADSKLELLNPFFEDNGLPLLKTLTINGYPLWYGRQMARKLNSAGTLSVKRAEELGAVLAERFPAAASGATSAGGSARASSPRSRAAGAGSLRAAPPLATPKSARGSAATSARDSATAFDANAEPHRLSKAEYKAQKEAEQTQAWELQRMEIQAALGGPVPDFLLDRLPSDGAIWCHHSLWHCRVYLACVRGHVGASFGYMEAGSVVAALHNGRPAAPQWRALTAFLEHLRSLGYVDYVSTDRRIEQVTVLADHTQPPKQ
jgi:hypothetical protein